MLQIYCHSRCTTCKKALKWLDDQGIAYELHDIETDHPDVEAIRKYHALSGLPLRRLFNTSGVKYRELGLSQKLPSMFDGDQYDLLASDGMLVKRPLAVGDGFVLFGFKEQDWADRLLGK